MIRLSADGYWICSQLSIYAIVWQLRRRIWRCSIETVVISERITTEEGQGGLASKHIHSDVDEDISLLVDIMPILLGKHIA